MFIVPLILFVIAIAGLVLWAPWRREDTEESPEKAAEETTATSEEETTATPEEDTTATPETSPDAAHAAPATEAPPTPPTPMPATTTTPMERRVPTVTDLELVVTDQLEELLTPFSNTPSQRAYAAELAPDIADVVSRRVEQDWVIDPSMLTRLKHILEAELRTQLAARP